MDPQQNTDRELWREPDTTGNGDFYSDSIHVTASGGIGINCAGHVVVMPLRKWHALALASPVPSPSADFKCYRCDKPLKPLETMEMCPDCYEAVDLEPPKRPSADARAKLEQAMEKMDLPLLVPHKGDCNISKSWGADMTCTCDQPERFAQLVSILKRFAALLALPPHEGETPPKPTNGLEDAWYAGRRSVQDIPPETATGPQLQEACRAYVDSVRHARAIWEGETLQMSLPPVVQTRPEEPR